MVMVTAPGSTWAKTSRRCHSDLSTGGSHHRGRDVGDADGEVAATVSAQFRAVAGIADELRHIPPGRHLADGAGTEVDVSGLGKRWRVSARPHLQRTSTIWQLCS